MAVSILAAEQEEHKIMRGLIAAGFSDTAIRSQERLIVGHVDLMIRQLRSIFHQDSESSAGDYESETAIVDLNTWFYWITSDIISDLSLGESLHCLEHLETPQYLRFLSVAPEWLLKAVVLYHVGLGAIVKVMAWFSEVLLARTFQGLKERLERRVESGKKSDDPIGLMLVAKDLGVSCSTPVALHPCCLILLFTDLCN